MLRIISLGHSHLSNDKIPRSLDQVMDKAIPSGDHVKAGISVRHGPLQVMEIDEPGQNGHKINGNVNGKRKERASMTNGKSYKDNSSEDEEDKPLVYHLGIIIEKF